MTLTTAPSLLLVHAHPDDETLWTGGTIARYAAAGARVTLVTCTLGEEGEVIPDELRGLASDRADQLGGYRIGELRRACAELGVTEQRFLGGIGRWRDSGMVWQERGKTAAAAPRTHPRALVAGDPAEQTAQLEAVLREVRPQVVVTYASDGGYGHPDHVRAHELTVAAVRRVPEVRRLFYATPSAADLHEGLQRLAGVAELPFPLPTADQLPAVDPAGITTAVDIADQLPAKLAALRAHRTQVRVWSDGSPDGGGTAAYALSNGIGQPVSPTEYYTLGDGDGTAPTTDLFGGLDTTSERTGSGDE
ncbi:N-acetyl-1-D-myo-inositol-2-amino-2-deoxy-alpha-D-glucopyranoside deacetylase [Actinopolyspora erythraea]|uniref:1D-myo-inositol 2-acetamido-2-deoxy-alpha-D-glucopyranoside deacetylase n=1 Tax=Actinopolyspora erythraea TaxID=414996 RepID=A0A099D154_9ACTN|nr:N-acetyl-1-D-myo-inositol-2-amino-2-deoxy-alpha-D-glucopyranoside deacetylase [Actinopolyspora erythraea]ASU79802.1 N-acetyl-1-D-myo-inositol-2-amino-2-deoxy-alpha-D-glucopyranoside deacetylase [Actinopolyspora erythraea]KGI79681.1 1D-myo-inositol 2-acetamido-2-deoxy-alpha-D-glucopyranoside deacetylase [Actinopolyspora erythraea]